MFDVVAQLEKKAQGGQKDNKLKMLETASNVFALDKGAFNLTVNKNLLDDRAELHDNNETANIIKSCAEIVDAFGRDDKILASVNDLLQALTPTNDTHPTVKRKALNEKTAVMRFAKEFSSISHLQQLIYVVSAGNLSQTKQYFDAFINLVNKYEHKIDKLIIIDSAYLNRYYSNRYSNKEQKSEWYSIHEAYFSKLKVEYEFCKWDSIVGGNETNEMFLSYQDMKRKVLLDYEGSQEKAPDAKFVDIVERLAHAAYVENIAPTPEASRKYLIEECAAALTFSGAVTYPRDFNPAIRYMVEKHNKGLILLTHKLKSK